MDKPFKKTHGNIREDVVQSRTPVDRRDLRSEADAEREVQNSKVDVWILHLSICLLESSTPLRRTTRRLLTKHRNLLTIYVFFFFFSIFFLQRITAETLLQTFMSRVITLNKVNCVLILRSSESIWSPSLTPGNVTRTAQLWRSGRAGSTSLFFWCIYIYILLWISQVLLFMFWYPE